MKKCIRKINNKGVSLVLVIVTMTFVSIIAALVLALTYNNLQAMRNGLSSSKNFYTAETAIDELKAKFYEWSDEAVRDAYPKWLQRYDLMKSEERADKFKSMYLAKLNEVLTDKFIDTYFSGGHVGSNIDDLFVSFTSNNVTWNDKVTPHIDYQPDKNTLIVKDISITYTDDKNYQTKITTDFNFNLSYVPFKSDASNETDASCSEYAIISDEQITNANYGPLTVHGSLYGGGYDPSTDSYSQPGFIFDSNKLLNIYADNIVSRNDLLVKNSAALNTNGIDGEYNYTGDNSTVNMWLRGIDLAGLQGTKLTINGDCYVYDDTTLDSVASELTVSGNYFGFNTDNSADAVNDADGIALKMGTPKGSSAIVVNGKDSKVDLTDCEEIFLAGKSFVSVPEIYGSPDISDTNLAFPEGESISYRGVQSAYLLPGDCLTGIGHNPLTEAEYKLLVQDLAKSPGERKYDINIDQNRRNGGVDLMKYLDPSQPYRMATVSYSANADSEKLVYLYLNFATTNAASRYFEEYYAKYHDLVETKMGYLGDGMIAFRPESLLTTGNVVSYDNGVVKFNHANTSKTSQLVIAKEADLNQKYVGMSLALDKDFAGTDTIKFTSDKFVDMTKIKSDVQTSTELDFDGEDGQPYYLITGKDITITGNVNAIVIAKGNVSIPAGSVVHGLVIARGAVDVSGDIHAEKLDVADLIVNNRIVNRYFYGEDSDIDEDGKVTSLYSSELIDIDYENWRKN